ncbi:MAG: hypothetical protein OXJ90_02110 [Spirochaetaceae bacterium]|nr:hypothetical protein [Spirochaetaceae bacterium]
MTDFDFITDEEFRRVLAADKAEMHRCVDSKSWKAVHVLAGSIVEAVLLDYLVAEGHVKKDEALTLDLGSAVRMAHKKEIISKRASDLSGAIRDYRNLVHPGKSIRVGEMPDENSAQVVVAILEMILGEIGNRKRVNYGYTAEQMVAKIARDPSVRGILGRLLKDVNEREVERLMLTVIPATYALDLEGEKEPYEQTEPHFRPMLTALYRTSYGASSCGLQAKVVQEFVRVIKEESEETVRTYCQEFFSMEGLKHIGYDDGQLVKEHYLDQLKSRRASEAWVRSLSGIGRFLSEEELKDCIHALIRIAAEGGDRIRHDVVSTCMWDIYWDVKKDMQAIVIGLLDFHIKWYVHDDPDKSQILQELKERVEIPF